MKLEPKSKPVRFRITYAGKEHFTFDSLRKSFLCNEIDKLRTPEVVKWLIQEGEKDIAGRLEHIIDKDTSCSPVEIASVFFPEAGLDGTDSPLPWFDFWLRRGDQNTAKSLVEGCYQTYKHHPDFEEMFRAYLQLEGADALFLLNEDIDVELAGIPMAIQFWIDNGRLSKAEEFIRKHQKVLAKEPAMKPFRFIMPHYMQIREIVGAKDSDQEITEFLQDKLEKYDDLSKLKDVMHSRFTDYDEITSAACMWIAIKAKDGNQVVVPTDYEDEGHVMHFLRLVGTLIHGIRRYSIGFYDKYATESVYHEVICNIFRKYFGMQIFRPETSDIRYDVYYNLVKEKNKLTAVSAIQCVCDSYMLTKNEFERLWPGMWYICE